MGKRGRPKGCTPERFKIFTVTPSGEKYSAGGLARRFGLCQATISARAREKGRYSYNIDTLREMARKRRGGGSVNQSSERRVKRRPMTIDDVEFNPTAFQRSMMGL